MVAPGARRESDSPFAKPLAPFDLVEAISSKRLGRDEGPWNQEAGDHERCRRRRLVAAHAALPETVVYGTSMKVWYADHDEAHQVV